jgi:hypothetical protein
VARRSTATADPARHAVDVVPANGSDEHARPRRERLAERLNAACYGTVLVLAALPLIDAEEVASGWGWELVTGIGVATWVAHLFAEIAGEHVRSGSPVDRAEFTRAMVDGLPIPLAAVLPGVMLGLGRVGVLDERVALWAAVIVAVAQLIGVGAFVGASVSRGRASVWWYALATAAIGLAVVSLKVALGH